MTRKEEIYARQLFRELNNTFYGKQHFFTQILGRSKTKTQHAAINISIEGAGVHWHCQVSNGMRQCIISCFDIDRNDIAYKGPEFYTSFKDNGDDIAHGRTFNQGQTIEAARDWMQYKTVDELYAAFRFIDKEKRLLLQIQSDINNAQPALINLHQNEVLKEQLSTFRLWLRHENRSCSIYCYGYESNPRYAFHWDDCLIFETSGADSKRLGVLIKKWVWDQEMPSTLKTAFPEIDFGRLAVYYEKGNGLEGAFMMSWDDIEDTYNTFSTLSDKKADILLLIRQMRAKGFDKTLRAGTSLFTLALSRSRKHGLHMQQARIHFSFTFIPTAMEIWTSAGVKIAFDKIEYTDEIEQLLRTLELAEID